MYVRGKANYETVIPSMRTFATRLTVQSPANNIAEGDGTTVGRNKVNCPPIRVLPPFDKGTKYNRSRQLTKKINDVMSIQPSSTYRLGMKWLEGFHTALHTGKLGEFTGHYIVETEDTNSGFSNLSQISVPESVTVSQLSFAEMGSQNLLGERHATSSTSDLEDKVHVPDDLPAMHLGTKEKQKADRNETKKTEATQRSDEAVEKGTEQTPITFASPPKRRGLSRRAEKNEESKKEMEEARRIQTSIREGKKARAVKLSHMEILSGSYSRSTTKPLVDKLALPPVEVQGALVMEKLREAIQAIDDKNNRDLLARWDGYGCATYGQLTLMEAVVTARNNFNLVEATMNWIDKVEFQVDSIVETFKDAMDVTKADYKKAVDEMNLGKWYLGRHTQFGVEFLDFRENVWLHSGSNIGALFMLRETYQAVGVVNPRFHDFDTMEQKLRIVGSYGADAPGLKSIISVINLGHHWGAFFVDVHARRCFLFDPMHLASNASTLKTAVRTVVEKIRHLTDQLRYEVVSGCEQKDSSSCGL